MKSFHLGWFYLVLGLAWAGVGIARFWFEGLTGRLWFYPIAALAFSAGGLLFFRQYRRERSRAASSAEETENLDP